MRIRTTRGSGQIGYRMSRRRPGPGYPQDGARPLRTVAILVLAAAAAVASIAFPPAQTLAPPDGAVAELSLR